MKFKSISSFFRGSYETSGNESRLPDEALAKQHNFDLEITGKLKRRFGYKIWEDLESSIPAYIGAPDERGFPGKIQAIYPYADYEGNNYLIIVCQGKIYLQRYVVDEKTKKWIQLNPTDDFTLLDKVRRVEIASYLDTVFINDIDNNIYIYNPLYNVSSGFTSISQKFIYFAWRRIYFRNNINYAADEHTYNIVTVTANTVVISGNHTANFKTDDKIILRDTVLGGSTNDGTYTVSIDSTYASGPNQTTITTVEAIPFLTGATGTVSSLYRIFIDIDTTGGNIEGNLVGKSLEDIAFYDSLGAAIIDDFDNLNLGYGIRVGSDIEGLAFFIGENLLDAPRAGDTDVYIIKFDDRFLAKDFIQYTAAVDRNIINFGYADKNIYMFCSDGEVHKTNIASLKDTLLNSGAIAHVVAPTASGGTTQQFALFANENSFWLLSEQPAYNDLPVTPYLRDISPGFTFDKISNAALTTNVFGGKVNWDGTQWWTIEYSDWIGSKTPILYVKRIDTSFISTQFTYAILDNTLSGTKNAIVPECVLENRAGTYHLWAIAASEDYLYDFNLSTGGVPLSVSISSLAWPITMAIYNNTHILVGFGGSEVGLKIYDIAGASWTTVLEDIDVHVYKIYADSTYIIVSGAISNEIPVLLHININGTVNYQTNTAEVISDIEFDGTEFWTTLPTERSILIYTTALSANGGWAGGGGEVPLSLAWDSASSRMFVGNIGEISSKAPWEGDGYSDKYFYQRKQKYGIVRIFEKGVENYTGAIYFDHNINYLSFSNGYVFVSSYKNNIGFSHLAIDKDFPYINLLRFDLNGNYKEAEDGNNIIYLFGKSNAVNSVQQMSIEGDYVYAGISQVGIGAVDPGLYAKLNYKKINDLIETISLMEADTRARVFNNKIWFLKHEDENNNEYIRFNFNWDWKHGYNEYSDFDYLINYNSNVVEHTYKQTISRDDENIVDQIRPMGTPKTPKFYLEPDDLTPAATFITGTRLKYFIGFVFADGSTSLLSKESQEIIIPQINVNLTVSAVSIATEQLTINTHGLLDDDIVTIASTGTLPNPLVADTWYYVIFVDANNIQLATSPGGGAINLTTTGTGTITVLQINKQPVKIVISDINTYDERSLSIYSVDAVSKIQIYRAQKNVDELYSAPSLLAELEKNDDDEWYYTPLAPPYEMGTYEDNVQLVSYNPFTESNVLKYLAKNIVIHKNRLILINNIGLNTRNSNIIQYSDIDNAQSLPPENVRSIQSGDSDILISAISAGDYLYFFKKTKVYAILGDVTDGQLLDIANTVGCAYKNMTTAYDNRVVYFLNQDGIYGIEGGTMVNLDQKRIENYFDPEREDAIDFSLIAEHGFVFVDFKEKEIYFHVPQKGKTQNSLIIVLSIETNNFKTYSYYHSPFEQKNIYNVETGQKQIIFGTYDGDIYEISKDNNDGGHPVSYMIRTKEFILSSNFSNKKFKMIRVFGKFLKEIFVSYWLDGQRQAGGLTIRKKFDGMDGTTLFVKSTGLNNKISIEVSGEDKNQQPLEIEEILIGYDNLIGLKR